METRPWERKPTEYGAGGRALIQPDWCEKRKSRRTHGSQRERPGRPRQEGGHLQGEEGGLRRKPPTLALDFQLPNCEKINFCGFRRPDCGLGHQSGPSELTHPFTQRNPLCTELASPFDVGTLTGPPQPERPPRAASGGLWPCQALPFPGTAGQRSGGWSGQPQSPRCLSRTSRSV